MTSSLVSYGTCTLVVWYTLGSHTQQKHECSWQQLVTASVKTIRKDSQFEASFANEAYILVHCCNTNIPLLLRVMTTTAVYECLLMSFHGIHGV